MNSLCIVDDFLLQRFLLYISLFYRMLFFILRWCLYWCFIQLYEAQNSLHIYLTIQIRPTCLNRTHESFSSTKSSINRTWFDIQNSNLDNFIYLRTYILIEMSFFFVLLYMYAYVVIFSCTFWLYMLCTYAIMHITWQWKK